MTFQLHVDVCLFAAVQTEQSSTDTDSTVDVISQLELNFLIRLHTVNPDDSQPLISLSGDLDFVGLFRSYFFFIYIFYIFILNEF